ncbi:MAG: membrane protein [Lysobacteraceae bacterium]|nr:MAG: membrane protein [Xanthomonadaceae bacterium]
MRLRTKLKYITGAVLCFLTLGLVVPENPVVPVTGATAADWNQHSFWYEPWGSSGVHKGIDIFGATGTPVVSSTVGLVLYSGQFSKGGNVVVVLGPKWRFHYYAHLESRDVVFGTWLTRSEQLGTLGTSGNAVGKQPHLHYSILSLVPLPWLATADSQGWKRMFYIDPAGRFG